MSPKSSSAAWSGGAASSFTRRHRIIIACSALFLLALVASAAQDIVHSRQEARHNAERQIDTLARVLTEQTQASLKPVEVVVQEIAQAYRAGALPPVGSREMFDHLRRQRDLLSATGGIVITDATGERRAGAAWWPNRGGNIAGRELFKTLSSRPGSETFTDTVTRSETPGRWIVPIAARLDGPDGQFEGVVSSAINADYFQSFYARAALRPGMAVVLLDADGTMVARYPAMPMLVGQRAPEYLQLIDSARSGTGTDPARPTEFVSAADGAERYGVTRQVPGHPLYVSVTQDANVALDAWREQAIGTAVRTALLVAAAIGLLIAVLRQLTRVEAARAGLKASEERFALAVAGANDGIWDWDLVGDQLYYSDRAQYLLGIGPGGPNTRSLQQWSNVLRFDPQDRQRQAEAVAEHLAGRTPLYDGEFRLATESGEHWVRIRGVCVRDARGSPLRMAGSIEDISERKRAERERQRLELQLRQAQKLEAIGTLAGGIAHDFNNILGAILGYGELARAGAGENAPLRRHIEGVMTAALRAKSLVERILAFSRSGGGERVPVPVQSVVGEALDLLLPSLPRGVKLTRELTAGDAAVLSDPAQIHQVVMNLCTNATQAMDHGGVLSVRLDVANQSQGTLVATGELPAGQYVRLSVQDQGQGIREETIERIFDPFFTTKGMGAGTGLGLSLVHGIVTDLGGGIEVVSEPGAGTRFIIYIPWFGRVAATKELDAPLLRGDGERILLIDDETALVQSGEEIIASLGYEPVGFTSSVAALDAFRADPEGFDAILSDETMPEVSGAVFAAEVRKLRGDIPIVLMSGYVTPALTARARAAGVSEVLSKPLAKQDLARCLAAVLLRRRRNA